MKSFLLLFSLLGILLSSPSFAIDESGPGNGTDYVKVLFAQARLDLLNEVSNVDDNAVQTYNLDPDVKSWLLTIQNGQSRWSGIKYYLHAMELRYQQDPCTDFSQKPASICFFNQDPADPYVMISLQENKLTTENQAQAMLIHESGHFIGEPDHLFLDRVGVQMVAAMQAPSVLVAEENSTETVADPFTGKSGCDAGTSEQAQLLKQKLVMDLSIQCGDRKITCDTSQVQVVYTGTANFTPGVGYDMTVTCHAQASLSLH